MATDTGDTAGTAIGGLDGRLIAGRFRVSEVVSRGANTVIAAALDEQTNLPVTLKIVQPELAESEEFRRAFRRHAEVATALTHPNIATVIAWGDVELDGTTSVFWVVEYLGGGSLRDLFDRGRLLQPSQALVVGLEACRALDVAHQRGIVHTELTPAKMVFGDDRRLRLVDFGFARLLGAQAWDDPSNVPTHVARYASPEQALGLDVDVKTDVYALTLALIESVTGSVPFAADSTVATLTARVGKLMPVSADLGSLAAVLERAGRPEAEDRSTAAELGKALVQAASKLPRPEPIEIIGGGLFAVAEMRRPTDPTGGLARPAAGPAVDEPAVDDVAVDDPEVDDDAGAAGDATEVLAAGAGSEAAATPTEVLGADEPPAPADEAARAAETEALIVMTGAADPPTGAVEVGADQATTTLDASQLPPPAGGQTTQMPVTAPLAVGTDEDTPEVYDDERASRSFGKFFLLALVVLTGLAALSYAGWLLLRTKSFEVPVLAGVNQDVALNEVAGNGWEITIERERNDDEPTIDNVIRTVPGPGVRLDEGAEFLIVVSDGPELRTLPELTDLMLADAEAQLRDLRLLPVVEDRLFSETVPLDAIISWQVQGDPAAIAGSQVLPDTTVLLTVSDGPAPRAVPALSGLLAEQATVEVESLQLVLVRGEDVFSDTVPAGVVVSQEPAAGTLVPRGGTVTIQVSKGPDIVAVPDLTGLSYADAEALLLDTGFTIGNLLGTTEGSFVSLTIGGQSVEVGQLFPRGTAADLIFL